MAILQNVFNDFDNLLESLTLTEWTMFAEGFATLLYIRFLIEKHAVGHPNIQNTDAFALLCRIPVSDRYRTIANAVLTRFNTFEQTLSSSNWSELMIRVSTDRFLFTILEKTKSIEEFFTSITQTLGKCGQVNDFQNKLQIDFDARVYDEFGSKS